MNPRYVTPPEQLERALRDLLRGWQEVVFAEPTATDDYRALTQQVILDAEASLKDGATPYQTVIFALAPPSASTRRCSTTSPSTTRSHHKVNYALVVRSAPSTHA